VPILSREILVTFGLEYGKRWDMRSLQMLFVKGDVFYDLLEASAQEAYASVQSLLKIIRQPGQVPSIEEFVKARRKEKQITTQITEELCKRFVTPFDREDIEALSMALYKIPKTVEKFAERLIIGADLLKGVDFSRHVALLQEATDTVLAMVKALRARSPRLDYIREQNARLQQIERDADNLMTELMRELYSGKFEPLQALLLRDLYELLEKVIDRCRDASNVILHVMLKNA
jgi:uncharacterized protein Yka (UPF0111/DUF47 family)